MLKAECKLEKAKLNRSLGIQFRFFKFYFLLGFAFHGDVLTI